MSKIETFQNPYELADYLDALAGLYSPDYGRELLMSNGEPSGYFRQDGVELMRKTTDFGELTTSVSFSAERLREQNAGQIIITEYTLRGLIQKDEMNLSDMPETVRQFSKEVVNKKDYRWLKGRGGAALQYVNTYCVTSDGAFDHDFSMALCLTDCPQPLAVIPEELWQEEDTGLGEITPGSVEDWSEFMNVFSAEEQTALLQIATNVEEDFTSARAYRQMCTMAEQCRYLTEIERMRRAGNLARIIFSNYQ